MFPTIKNGSILRSAIGWTLSCLLFAVRVVAFLFNIDETCNGTTRRPWLIVLVPNGSASTRMILVTSHSSTRTVIRL